MVAYSFKKRFEESIRSGLKTHTLRNDRKRHARPGEFVQLYVGMRTRYCRKIMVPDPVCIEVKVVEITFSAETIKAVLVDGLAQDVARFAISDGFETPDDMFKFWCNEHGKIVRWSGVMIVWEPSGQRCS